MTYQVALWRGEGGYPAKAPFDPPERFPELGELVRTTDRTNTVYAGVRELFRQLGYDASRFGTSSWNPLSWLIRPGDTVFVKPNLIAERNAAHDEWLSVITHGSVLRAALDYITLALDGHGRIILGDAPQTDSDIHQIRTRLGIDALECIFREREGVRFEFLDLRDEYWPSRDGVVTARTRLDGDPSGTTIVDLANDSFFAEIDHLQRRYYGAFYAIDETNKHHGPGRHEYKIAQSPLRADVFFSVPKLKTHKKVGVTLNLKGLVGINGDKNFLPHYALGSPADGGDQFPSRRPRSRLENLVVLPAKRLLASGNPVAVHLAARLKRHMYRVFGTGEETIRAGNWWGNDTCWRMSLDLNRALLYATPEGELGAVPKRYFSLVDGIVGMEGNGPTAGIARSCGMLLAGDNPAAVDAVGARMMGFDPQKLPIIKRSFDRHHLQIAAGAPDQIKIIDNQNRHDGSLADLGSQPLLRFEPHFGWKGHIEV